MSRRARPFFRFSIDRTLRARGHIEDARSDEVVFDDGPALFILDETDVLQLREVLRSDGLLDPDLDRQLADTPGPLLELLEAGISA